MISLCFFHKKSSTSRFQLILCLPSYSDSGRDLNNSWNFQEDEAPDDQKKKFRVVNVEELRR